MIVCLPLALAACSDGGRRTVRPPTTTPTPPPTPTPDPGPTWRQGVYDPAATFEGRCENPRSGVDIEGNPFLDQQGSTLEENFWLRSWTNETYLWNREVVDRDPALFDDRVAYFNVLRTEEITPSGQPKDNFHFSQPTEDYLAQRNAAPTAGYGAQFIAIMDTPPRDVRVLYTNPGTPAAMEVNGSPNLIRGSRILEVDGIDAVNATGQAEIDALNAGLFPPNAGEDHDFLVEDPDGTQRAITMTSGMVSTVAVNRTRIISTPTGDVGYLLFNTFSTFASEEELATAISGFAAAGVSDLVLDLRYNGGGLLAVASQLGYMIAGASATAGKTFELLRFNDDAGAFNPVTGELNNPIPFIDVGVGFSVDADTPLPSLDLNRVYILTTGRSCSASEAVINGLRGIDVEVVLIGDRTCGKPFGFYPTDNCGETYYTIQFQGVNDKGFGDYADGFIADNAGALFGVRAPGCAVSDDLSTALGDETEDLLEAALEFRASGACPSDPLTATSSVQALSTPDDGVAVTVPEGGVFASNRDMTLPEQRRIGGQ